MEFLVVGKSTEQAICKATATLNKHQHSGKEVYVLMPYDPECDGTMPKGVVPLRNGLAYCSREELVTGIQYKEILNAKLSSVGAVLLDGVLASAGKDTEVLLSRDILSGAKREYDYYNETEPFIVHMICSLARSIGMDVNDFACKKYGNLSGGVGENVRVSEIVRTGTKGQSSYKLVAVSAEMNTDPQNAVQMRMHVILRDWRDRTSYLELQRIPTWYDHECLSDEYLITYYAGLIAAKKELRAHIEDANTTMMQCPYRAQFARLDSDEKGVRIKFCEETHRTGRAENLNREVCCLRFEIANKIRVGLV